MSKSTGKKKQAEYTLQCQVCKKWLKNSDTFRKHDPTKCKERKPNENLRCKVCTHVNYLRTPRNLKNHLLTQHGIEDISKNVPMIVNGDIIHNGNNINCHNTGDVNIDRIINNDNKIVNNDNKIINNDNKTVYNNIQVQIGNFPSDFGSYRMCILSPIFEDKNPFIKFVELTNLNKDTPEHHNIICLGNEAKIYHDDKWNKYTASEMYTKLCKNFENFTDYLETIKTQEETVKIMKADVIRITNENSRKGLVLSMSEKFSRTPIIQMLKHTRKKCHGIEDSYAESSESTENVIKIAKFKKPNRSKHDTESLDSSEKDMIDREYYTKRSNVLKKSIKTKKSDSEETCRDDRKKTPKKTSKKHDSKSSFDDSENHAKSSKMKSNQNISESPKKSSKKRDSKSSSDDSINNAKLSKTKTNKNTSESPKKSSKKRDSKSSSNDSENDVKTSKKYKSASSTNLHKKESISSSNDESVTSTKQSKIKPNKHDSESSNDDMIVRRRKTKSNKHESESSRTKSKRHY